ncbi:hypothetical protein R1sor_020454 [Riccia sorocarpa]|uniref:Trimethylguanosine synthase n=1 Tax=Riccia sorocarpa TaxID=122646 RepID=A0ABD3IJX7_9MARC
MKSLLKPSLWSQVRTLTDWSLTHQGPKSRKKHGSRAKQKRKKKPEDLPQRGRAKEQPKPGSGRTRSAKKQTKDKAPKQLKKKRDEPAEAELVLETPALEIEPNVTEAGTSTPVVEEQAPGNDKSTQKEEARQRKRTKKQANTVLYKGVFREDIYFPMKNRCVIMKSSLKETHELLHGNKTKAIKDPVPIVEELKKMCAALESKRAGGYLMNKKPHWKQVTSFDVQSDLPQFDEVRNYKVYHSKVEVFCKASHNFIIPKLDMPPFDANNTGRDSSFICNYNHLSSSKLDDGGRRKCTGFVQTLLENFTAQGDIVIDFAGGWGATLQAANNCGRCCIVAETRRDAYDSLQRVLGSLHQPEQANPEPIVAQQKSLGKKPLGDDDDLGDLFE